MEYFAEVLNRRTGDLETVSIGDWITITEFGKMVGEGPREIRSILHELDFLQPETTGDTRLTRLRICHWVSDMGWGMRHDRRGKPPFDVIAPEAQQWLLGRIRGAKTMLREKASGPAMDAARDLRGFIAWRVSEGINREKDFDTWRKFLWLSDHHPWLTQEELGSILHVSQQMVSRYAKDRHGQINRALKKRSTPLPNKKLSLQGELWINSIQGGLDGVVPIVAGPL